MLRARGTHFQIPQLVTMSNSLTHAAMDSCLISSFLGLIGMGCPPLLTPRQMRHISDPRQHLLPKRVQKHSMLWLFLGNNATQF